MVIHRLMSHWALPGGGASSLLHGRRGVKSTVVGMNMAAMIVAVRLTSVLVALRITFASISSLIFPGPMK